MRDIRASVEVALLVGAEKLRQLHGALPGAAPPEAASSATCRAAMTTIAIAEGHQSARGLLTAGRSNQAIAGELVVTLDTVKKHVGHVLGKLGAASRSEAVALGAGTGPDPLTRVPGRCLHVLPRPCSEGSTCHVHFRVTPAASPPHSVLHVPIPGKEGSS